MKHVRLETILWKKKFKGKSNCTYEPCVVQKFKQAPFFAYIVLTTDSLQIVNWTVQVKNIELLVNLHRILQIQTVSDVPAFVLYGVYADNSHIRVLHSIAPEQVETIELAFLQKNSHFPKLLQRIWLNRLADCATGVPEAALNHKGELHLLDVYSCYEYFHRIATSDENGKNVYKIAQKLERWLIEIPEFRKLLLKDSTVLDWLLREIKKQIEIFSNFAYKRQMSDNRKFITELLKCLNMLIGVGIEEDDSLLIYQLLKARLSTIVEDILYNLINKEDYFLKFCVDIFFTLSLSTVAEHSIVESRSNILLLNVRSSTSFLQLIKLVLLVMSHCMAFLKQEQLQPFEAIVVFKALYAIEQLAENKDVKNLMQLEFQDEFKYFPLSIQLSDKFEIPFKEHLITLLNRFKNHFFLKKTKF